MLDLNSLSGISHTTVPQCAVTREGNLRLLTQTLDLAISGLKHSRYKSNKLLFAAESLVEAFKAQGLCKLIRFLCPEYRDR